MCLRPVSYTHLISMICYFFGGWIADRVSPRKLLTISFISTGLVGLLFSTFPSYCTMRLIFAAFGVTLSLIHICPVCYHCNLFHNRSAGAEVLCIQKELCHDSHAPSQGRGDVYKRQAPMRKMQSCSLILLLPKSARQSRAETGDDVL